MSIVKAENSILKGRITVPPSKSMAHRALICSFLAGGGTVSPLIPSKDMQATVSAIKALQNSSDVVDCIESGSTLRFMIPIACALGKTVTFVGSGLLPQRPIGDYLRLLPEHNVQCVSDGGLPLTVSGKLTGGTFMLSGDVSSQYITGLLLALPLLKEDSRIILTTPLQSKPYVDMTIKVMSDFGVEIKEEESAYFVKGNQHYIPQDYTIESDWSQAAFFMVGGALFGDVTLSGLNMDSTQGDKEIVDILRRFGADISFRDGDICCKKSSLNGTEIDATDIPDMVPSLAVAAAYANGKTVIKGAQRLRFKESDRIESIVTNLKKMGADIISTDDGMIIKDSKLKGAQLKGFNDHRIVMSMAVAALGADGTTYIDDAESIKKSYPDFFEDYNKLGGKANVLSNR